MVAAVNTFFHIHVYCIYLYQVNSAIGIVTSGYGVEPPAGMDHKYYAEKKRRHKDWIKKRVNPEWVSRDPEML